MAISFGNQVKETKNSPCVYKHNGILDMAFNNGEKRTCDALLSESNSRIDEQQKQLRASADAIERLNNQLAQLSGRNAATLEEVPRVGEAPTLSAVVAGTDEENRDDDDDDD